MKKAERLNQELIYLHDKKQFQLANLMETFQISKRTALRDVQELEAMGLPLYVENGRNGGYRILHNTLLPPIYFQENELFAIFFSLQLLKLLKDSPFERSYKQIKEKLLQTFNTAKQEKISRATDIVRYEGISQINAAKNLAEIFSSILKNEALSIYYTRYKKEQKLILPFHLVIIEGFWYCTAFDLSKKEWRTYRCDYMEIIEAVLNHSFTLTQKEIADSYKAQQENYRSIAFKVKISAAGKEYFLKHPYSNMELTKSANEQLIVGKISPDEVTFLVNYLLGFGEHMQILEPRLLIDSYTQLLHKMLEKHASKL